MFEKLREALESALDAATRPDGNQRVKDMHRAVIEAKTSLGMMEDGIEKTQRLLTQEKSNLEDALRRGKMADEIGDAETAEIAQQFVDKHRERAAVLKRKLEAQMEEFALARREVDDMKGQLKRARANISGPAADGMDAAWREIESATSGSPGDDWSDEVLKHQFDRAEREASAQAKLDELKKKMGK